jgi:hypothetical protein
MIARTSYGFNVDLRTPAVIPEPVKRNLATVIVEHVNRHKTIYRIGALTLTMIFAGGLEAFAEPFVDGVSAVGDNVGIDAGANKLYNRLLLIGKWVITIKGAFDTISHTVQGDFVSARKSGLSYLLVYVILRGLPWGFRQVDILLTGV